jgi:hypothetical protein
MSCGLDPGACSMKQGNTVEVELRDTVVMLFYVQEW